MRASRDELPVLVEAGDASVRGADWDGMRVVLISIPASTDFRPLLKGLLNDRCPCPHWGYVLKGRLRIDTNGQEEVLKAGDAYYMAPGHTADAMRTPSSSRSPRQICISRPWRLCDETLGSPNSLAPPRTSAPARRPGRSAFLEAPPLGPDQEGGRRHSERRSVTSRIRAPGCPPG